LKYKNEPNVLESAYMVAIGHITLMAVLFGWIVNG
jgi:hypothetical protein